MHKSVFVQFLNCSQDKRSISAQFSFKMGHEYEAVSSCYFTSLKFIITYIVVWSYLYCFYGNLRVVQMVVFVSSCFPVGWTRTNTLLPSAPPLLSQPQNKVSSVLLHECSWLGRCAGRLWHLVCLWCPGVAMSMTTSAHLPQFCLAIWTQSRLWHLSYVRDQGGRLRCMGQIRQRAPKNILSDNLKNGA